MKALVIRQHQMIERVVDFGTRNLALFPAESIAPELVASMGALVKQLNALASDHVTGAGNLKTSMGTRNGARKALKLKMALIEQTAEVLKLDQFYLPRPKTDAAWIAAATAFAQQADPFRKDFIRQGLPEDFIESLNAAAGSLKDASRRQTETKGAKSSSAVQYEDALQGAFTELKRLDALVKNTLSDNPGVMAAWKVARRVGRTASSHTVQTSAPASPQGPAAPVAA